MTTDVLLSTRDAGVLRLTLNRPHARNALDIELTRALVAQIKAFDVDPSLLVLVITGSDPGFCAGLDLKAFSDPHSPRAEVGLLLNDLPRRAKPVIGAINGAAITGGLELALGCDFLIGSERAIFGDTHTKIGTLAGGGMSSRLPHTIGVRLAKQMSFTGQPIDAQTALRVGLLNEVVPHAELLPRCMLLAQAIAAFDPALVGTVKSVLDRGAQSTLAESILLEREALASRRMRGEVPWNQ